MARDILQAELLAESILAKIRIGWLEMEPVFDMPVGADRDDIIVDTNATVGGSTSVILWYYSIEINEVPATFGSDFLVEIAVTVRQNLPDEYSPAVCRLVRWLAVEPLYEEEE
jgi:hypothetical protein